MRLLMMIGVAAMAAAGPAAGEQASLPDQESAATTQEQEPQDPAVVFSSEVEVVLHSVAVLDRERKPVIGLERHDFTVYEDDEPQELSVFLTPSDNPLDIALVTDASSSLSHYARPVRSAAKAFLQRLSPLDCVYLLPFNDQVGPGVFERGLLLTPRVDGIFMTGGTALYDALVHGMSVLDRTLEPEESRSGCGAALSNPSLGAPERRRAVVLLTDGADKDSQRRFDEVLGLARRLAIPVFPVMHGEARVDQRLRATLERLAGETGGLVVDAASPADLARAFADVVNLLRASYVLGYRAPQGEETLRERTIRVRSLPLYRLVYRTSYWR